MAEVQNITTRQLLRKARFSRTARLELIARDKRWIQRKFRLAKRRQDRETAKLWRNLFADPQAYLIANNRKPEIPIIYKKWKQQ